MFFTLYKWFLIALIMFKSISHVLSNKTASFSKHFMVSGSYSSILLSIPNRVCSIMGTLKLHLNRSHKYIDKCQMLNNMVSKAFIVLIINNVEGTLRTSYLN